MTSALQSEIVAVYVIFGSDEEARRIGRAMVERRLAACVNILGACHSIYRWQGAVEESSEVAAIFKTRFEQAEALMAAIHLDHSYDVPAITVLPIASTHREYLEWVVQETSDPIEDESDVRP
jgi:periplasmic divalent cation tolerance protein